MNGFVQMMKGGCLSEERGICRGLLQAGVKGGGLKGKLLLNYCRHYAKLKSGCF